LIAALTVDLDLRAALPRIYGRILLLLLRRHYFPNFDLAIILCLCLWLLIPSNDGLSQHNTLLFVYQLGQQAVVPETLTHLVESLRCRRIQVGSGQWRLGHFKMVG
jgi:hypothetical protein